MTTASCERNLQWLVVAVHHDDRTILGAGPQALFGVATLTADNTLHLSTSRGATVISPAGRVDPYLLAKAMLCKLHARREYAWW